MSAFESGRSPAHARSDVAASTGRERAGARLKPTGNRDRRLGSLRPTGSARVIGIAGVDEIDAAGPQQVLDLVDCLVVARLARLNLALQIDEGAIGAVSDLAHMNSPLVRRAATRLLAFRGGIHSSRALDQPVS